MGLLRSCNESSEITLHYILQLSCTNAYNPPVCGGITKQECENSTVLCKTITLMD